MADGQNALILIMGINIVLYVGLTVVGFNTSLTFENDLFNGDSKIFIVDDETGTTSLNENLRTFPEHKDNLASKVRESLEYVIDPVLLVLNTFKFLANVITVPFALCYNLWAYNAVMGKILTLLIFAPLSVIYSIGIFSFLRGVTDW